MPVSEGRRHCAVQRRFSGPSISRLRELRLDVPTVENRERGRPRARLRKWPSAVERDTELVDLPVEQRRVRARGARRLCACRNPCGAARSRCGSSRRSAPLPSGCRPLPANRKPRAAPSAADPPAVIHSSLPRIIACSMTFSSSRMLPFQGSDRSTFMVALSTPLQFFLRSALWRRIRYSRSRGMSSRRSRSGGTSTFTTFRR